MMFGFCVEKLLHFALNALLHFASMLLHFALVLHFAAIVITLCVSITFCGDYYILRRNKGDYELTLACPAPAPGIQRGRSVRSP